MYSLSDKRRKKRANKYSIVDNDLLIGEYSKNNVLNNKIIKDEYYTLMPTVEEIFNIIDKNQFKDKIIYSPCDDDNSNFVKYIKTHKEELQYKEYIYTSDDYNNHIDIFERCDYVITNPPFSKIHNELQPLIIKTKCKYFLIGSAFYFSNYYKNDNNIKFFYLDSCYRWYKFPSKNEDKKYIGYSIILGNGDILKSFENKMNNKMIGFIKNDLGNITVNINGETYPAIDYIKKFPKKYDGWVCAPITAFLYYNFFDFKLINYKDKISYDDNINRFKRILIKRKTMP